MARRFLLTVLCPRLIPLGATITSAICDGHSIQAELEQHEEDEHARLTIHAPLGNSHCDIKYNGGVRMILPPTDPQYGNPSTGMKLTGLHLDGHRLFIDADVNASGSHHFSIRTPWNITSMEGARTTFTTTTGVSEIEVKPPANSADSYRPTHIVINLSPR